MLLIFFFGLLAAPVKAEHICARSEALKYNVLRLFFPARFRAT